MLISVIVPTYNEEGNVQNYYKTVSGVLNQTGYDWEMIFIDDGSRDKSAALINELHQQDSRVHLLRLSRNFGAYSAVSAGLLYARGDAIISLNCDLQDPPELILEFLKHWEDGADVVWGVRSDRDDPGMKSVFANLFYWIVRKTIWSDFPAGGMDYGLFDKRVVQFYNSLPSRNTIPFLTIYHMGFRQDQIPYFRRAREVGVSNWSFGRRIKSAMDVIIDFSYFPIRMITTIGFTISALSFLYIIVVLVYRLVFGGGAPGWLSTVVLISLLGGVEFMVLGILGEYIWRVAEQVRQRPRFFIMSRTGFAADEIPDSPQERYIPHSHETGKPEHAEAISEA